MATPAPPSDFDDESLMFMTHAPGAIVPPRPPPDVNDSFAGKILGKFGIGTAADKQRAKNAAEAEDESSQTITGRLAEGAGRGAFDRAMNAGRSKARKKPEEKPDWADQHVSARPAAAGVQVVGTAPLGTTAPSGPSFLGLVAGALFAPLRGTPVTAVHVIMFSLAILLLELSPVLGLLACAVASLEIVSLHVRMIRESCAGRTKVVWPDVGGMFSALLPFTASTMVLVPALVLGLVAFGPATFTADNPSSVQARASRLITPIPKPEGNKAAPDVAFGQATVLALDAAIGKVGAKGPSDPTRPMKEVSQGLASSARHRVTTLVDFGHASGLGIAARVLALLALVYFPMALLCAVRIRSAYAGVHVPMIVRSIFRAFGGYLLVLLVFTGQVAAALAILFLLPSQLAGLGPAGHLIWVVVLSIALVASPMALGDLLGRLYRSKQLSLGWD